jgi:hypothetical protein
VARCASLERGSRGIDGRKACIEGEERKAPPRLTRIACQRFFDGQRRALGHPAGTSEQLTVNSRQFTVDSFRGPLPDALGESEQRVAREKFPRSDGIMQSNESIVRGRNVAHVLGVG